MEPISLTISIIAILFILWISYAILSIPDNTKKSNQLLRLILNDKNPERFKLIGRGKIEDTNTGKKL